jgi:hypothetical protein
MMRNAVIPNDPTSQRPTRDHAPSVDGTFLLCFFEKEQQHNCVRCAKRSHKDGGQIKEEGRLLYLPGEAKHNCNPHDGHNDIILNKKNNFAKESQLSFL